MPISEIKADAHPSIDGANHLEFSDADLLDNMDTKRTQRNNQFILSNVMLQMICMRQIWKILDLSSAVSNSAPNMSESKFETAEVAMKIKATGNLSSNKEVTKYFCAEEGVVILYRLLDMSIHVCCGFPFILCLIDIIAGLGHTTALNTCLMWT
jgi:hypothetical protein